MSKTTDLNKVVKNITKDPALTNLFQLNLHSMHIEFSATPPWEPLDNFLTDGEFAMLQYYLASTIDIQPSDQTLYTAITVMARQKTYHPIKRFLEALTWDGIPRLSFWLRDYAGSEDNSYTRAVSIKVLVAAIKRCYEPGCKFDYMKVLESVQGAKKSQLVEALGGEHYMSIEFGDRNKDTVDAMRRGWIIEIADLAGMRKHEIESLKAFLTRHTDWVRMPYGRFTQPYRRQSIFIGSHNPSGNNDYFSDDTGNRRFWPIECGKINLEDFRKVRDQLWAEAVVFYKNGEKIWLEEKEEKIAVNMQADRLIDDPWIKSIREYLEHKITITTTEILNEGVHMAIDRIQLSHQQRVGRIIRALKNWKRKQNTLTGEWYYEKEQIETTSKQPKTDQGGDQHSDAQGQQGWADGGD